MSIRFGRLQRKVLAVVLLLVVLPMMIAGMLSAHWVSQRLAQHLENLIREEAGETEEALEAAQRHGQLFAEVLGSSQERGTAGLDLEHGSIPPEFRSFAAALNLGLIQVYSADKRLLYSSPAVQVLAPWDAGQPRALLKVRCEARDLLASVAITPLPSPKDTRFYLVVGNLIDRSYLSRLGRQHGIETRLFYPDGRAAWGQSARPLASRLPREAIERLKRGQDYYSEGAEDGEYRGLYTPILDAAGHVDAVLFSGLKRRGETAVLADEVTLFLLIALLGCIIGGVTGLLLSRVVVRPVEQLRRGVLQLASQDFRVKVPDRQNDEVGELGRAFNAMAERLREARDGQLQQFRKEKLTAVGQLALTLAHEIRNPLGVIKTASSLLGKGSGEPDRQSALVRMIGEESQRLGRLLRDFGLLAPVRLARRQPVDPAQPLERAIQLALTARNDIRVKRRLNHGSATVYADPDLLEQAWVNLVNNALEAIGDGPGEIEVTTGVDQGQVVISLEDSGPGIPAELAPRLFEPFFTTKAQGSGLGLTLADNFIEANDGRLDLEPSEGRGAKFRVRFPVYVETGEAEPRVQELPAARGAGRA